ncbi:MAG: ACP S-malonyltransferase [Clostridium sp.]
MKRIAIMFPGQGSQYVGMGKSLYDNYEIARKTFEEASEYSNIDLKQLCFYSDIDELTKTENAQLAILTVSVAAFRVYMQEIGIEPLYCLGHSLGEISALTCAGVIKFKDAVKMVKIRGNLMSKAARLEEGTMAAVIDLPYYEIINECRKHNDDNGVVVVSNYNSDNQIVISGNKDVIAEMEENINALGGKLKYLKVSGAFHSPLMKSAVKEFKEEIEHYHYNEMRYPVLSNLTGREYFRNDNIPQYLINQIIFPVRWNDEISYLESHGVNIVLELFSQRYLCKLFRDYSGDMKALSFGEEKDVKEFMKIIAKENYLDKRIKNKQNVIEKCITINACTLNCNKNIEEYEKESLPLSLELKEMYKKYCKDKEKEIDEQIERKAIKLLEDILISKHVPKEKIKCIKNELVK